MISNIPYTFSLVGGTDIFPIGKYGTEKSTHDLSRYLSLYQEPDTIEISSASEEKLAKENEEKSKNPEKLDAEDKKSTNEKNLYQEQQEEVVEKQREAEGEARRRLHVLKLAADSIPKDLEATIRKAKTILKATLTQITSSSQDTSLVLSALKMQHEALLELKKEQTEESNEVEQKSDEENATGVESLRIEL